MVALCEDVGKHFINVAVSRQRLSEPDLWRLHGLRLIMSTQHNEVVIVNLFIRRCEWSGNEAPDDEEHIPDVSGRDCSSFFQITVSCSTRRRREKLQAHLKESRSLKNYSANSHNPLEVKLRAQSTNLQMHEPPVVPAAYESVCPPVSTWPLASRSRVHERAAEQPSDR
ncbi:unnamed protein product [Pleuronectes platessa]|uniref:Uncharacterized protein n=1 Tax=Pleuronectes platessa TaxID=8262 RepID=A0A9N7TIR7_PLEPL|nr:unnamed protein product [Pleuronectes platessa]